MLYPLKVSGKPASEEEHTVTLFYAVPVSVEGMYDNHMQVTNIIIL